MTISTHKFVKEGKYRTYFTPVQEQIATTGTKHCGKCNNDKAIEDFAKRKNTSCGYATWCKECMRQYDRENVGRFRETRTDRWYIRTYGKTLEWFRNLIAEQKGLCAICKDFMVEPHLDHNHETGQTRGALCHKCNIGLGHFNDSSNLLEKAAEYLRRFNARTS